MKERPILFNGAMVRAILDGSKTQTRRAMKPQPSNVINQLFIWKDNATPQDELTALCPYGQPGDLLYVREALRMVPGQPPDDGTLPVISIYDADGSLTPADAWPWRRSYLPPMHCPKGLSRILLKITGVRVERLQDISDDDCRAEGCAGGQGSIPGYQYSATPSEHFWYIWESTGGNWDANPWVWVVEFRRVDT